MSVLTFLEETISSVKIADWERTAIDTSIIALSTKLDRHFNNLHSKYVYGSYDRRTILRRSKDANSDVDYMVVFNDGSQFQPQTLMTRLRIFAETYYTKSEIYQSTPTIVLELSHIKFELAPAYVSWGTYYIPAPASSYSSWISTNPNKMKTDLDTKQSSNNYKIRDVIQLLKYWNVINGKIYSSYELESYVVSKYYYLCSNLKDYFYSAVSGLPTVDLSTTKLSKVSTLKQIIANTKSYEDRGMPVSAEEEIKKAF